MSRELVPVMDPVVPGDTQWAIAGKVPLSALERCRRELDDWLQGEGSKVVSGSEGFAALLVFGGPPEGESLAVEISRKHKTPIYVLDFNDERGKLTLAESRLTDESGMVIAEATAKMMKVEAVVVAGV